METGYLTFGEIYNQASRVVQDPTSSFISMIKEEINDYYVMAAKRTDWRELRRLVTSGISFTAGAGNLYLPRDVGKIIAIVDNTNNRWLDQYPMDFILYASPAFYDEEGTAIAYSPIGFLGREADFSSSAELIRAVSSSSSDTTQTVRLVVKDSNGLEREDTLSLNGTSNVDTANTWDDLLSVSCDDAKQGVVTISGVTSGTVYVRLASGEKTFRTQVLRLYQPSEDANSIALLYKKAVRRMQNDDDVPEIPIGEYLRKIAISKGYQFDGDKQNAREVFAESEKMFSEDVDSSTGWGTWISAPRPRPRTGILNSSWRQSRPYQS